METWARAAALRGYAHEDDLVLAALQTASRRMREGAWRSPWQERFGSLGWHLYALAISLFPIAVFLALAHGRSLPVGMLLASQVLAILGLMCVVGEIGAVMFTLDRRERHGLLARQRRVEGAATLLLHRFGNSCDWLRLQAMLQSWKERYGGRLQLLLALAGVALALVLAETSAGGPALCSVQAPSGLLLGAVGHAGLAEPCAWVRLAMWGLVGSLAGAMAAYLRLKRAFFMADVLGEILARQGKATGSSDG